MKYIIFLSLLFFVISCKKEESQDFIQIEPSEISDLGYDASSFKLQVFSETEWTVVSSQSWCKVIPQSGTSGFAQLTVFVNVNNSNQTREAVLTFKSGSLKKSVYITQNKYVQQVIFDDQNFKKYCLENFDVNQDDILNIEEAAKVTELNISGLGISSLGGLEYFSLLQSLNCSNNMITELDISSLDKLTTLNCSNNNITTLKIQSNINLNSLNCTGNPITKIFVWTGFKPGNSFLKPDIALFIEPEFNTPVGYSLVWQDEFNDPLAGGKAALPNTSDWWYETGNNGWGNNELQNYIPAISGSDTCAYISNGSLKIIAKKSGGQVLSSRINTHQSWTYGYFEARLKLPAGKGTWPAFWMMPKNFTAWPDDGEIDIMEEVGYHPNYVSSSIHCKAYNHSLGTQKTAEKLVPTAQSEFHVYAVEWTTDFVKGYIDGEKYFEFLNDHAINKNTWPFNTPFYLKLNLAWGGNWGGAQGVDETVLPATYEIDYVRVFQK